MKEEKQEGRRGERGEEKGKRNRLRAQLQYGGNIKNFRGVKF